MMVLIASGGEACYLRSRGRDAGPRANPGSVYARRVRSCSCVRASSARAGPSRHRDRFPVTPRFRGCPFFRSALLVLTFTRDD